MKIGQKTLINNILHTTKAIRNAGKVLNNNIVAINKFNIKLKMWSFKNPHYA